MSAETEQGIRAGEEEISDTTLDDYLAFVSDGLNFAVSAKYVTEIITNFIITPLPRVPDYIRGIFNLRGQVMPIIDARLRMRQRPDDGTEQNKCVIVIICEDVSIGLLVDGVSHVVNIKTDDILPPLASNRQELVNGIVHINSEDYLVLDCERLVGHIQQ